LFLLSDFLISLKVENKAKNKAKNIIKIIIYINKLIKVYINNFNKKNKTLKVFIKKVGFAYLINKKVFNI